MKKLLALVLALTFLVSCSSGETQKVPAETDAEAVESITDTKEESETTEIMEEITAETDAEPAEAPSIAHRMTESDRPCIVETIHPTDAPVIADIIATDPEYGADPTGETDSTAAIKKALRDCQSNGGGTVYLPAGTYRVSETITIYAFTTLRGDWIDPDECEDPSAIENYGTVILSYQKSSTKTSECLFDIRGSAGVRGLTIYYPEQDIDNVKPYPFTFYTTGNGMGGYMLASVQDCTVINGYAGVGACVSETNAHEMLTVDNVKGTFLSVGMEAYNQADVGTWKSVKVSPSYWAEAAAGLKAADYGKVADYMKKNAVGMRLGDLEWTELADVEIESCKTGITTVKGKRIQFAGSLFDVSVKDCTVGLDVQDLDPRWGMTVARCSFEGSEASVRNNTLGLVKMTDVELNGPTAGKGDIVLDQSDLSAYTVDYKRTYKAPEAILYTADIPADYKTDVSALLQQALDEVGKTGGILYLTPGFYLVNSPVTVPSGVELRGSSAVPTREQSDHSRGTLIVTTYGVGSENPAEMPALITLSEGSGISGMRFYYYTNNPDIASETPYTIRGNGADVYAVNCSIVASGSGIDFTGCDNHYIRKFVGGCYYNTLKAGGKNGLIEGCLQNGNTFTRSGINFLKGWFKESEIWDKLFPKLRKNSIFLTLDGAENETVFNFFAYGVVEVVRMENSKNVLLANIGGDNIGVKSGLLRLEASDVTAINILRYNGRSYKADDASTMKLYNRLTIEDKSEKNEILGETVDFVNLNE